MPKVAQYIARVREFSERYPWVREYATWNEANHGSVQPTGPQPTPHGALLPRAAARVRGHRLPGRRGGGAAGGHVEDTGAGSSASAGPRAAGPHLWGVHNYPDVTRLSRRNTRIFLRRVRRDEVWITETGGIVRFAKRWRLRREPRRPLGPAQLRLAATVAPDHARLPLQLAADPLNRRWDSGFFAADGIERRAYSELLDGLALDRFRPLPPPVIPLTEADGPLSESDAATGLSHLFRLGAGGSMIEVAVPAGDQIVANRAQQAQLRLEAKPALAPLDPEGRERKHIVTGLAGLDGSGIRLRFSSSPPHRRATCTPLRCPSEARPGERHYRRTQVDVRGLNEKAT